MKNLAGGEFEIQSLHPLSIPVGSYFGYNGCTDTDLLDRFKQLDNGQYASAGGGWVHTWSKEVIGSCPLHPLKGLCLDGVTR